MRTLKLILLFFLITLYSCSQKKYYSKVNAQVVRLSNKIIPLVNFLDNPDSSKQALLFLDSATTIDNNCYLCYYNKLMFLYPLKKFDKAIETISECIRLNPSGYDLYLTGGILYEKIGDTVRSNKYFFKSLTMCNSVLDTMISSNGNFDLLVINKALNLIMSSEDKEGNVSYQKLCDKQTDSTLQKLIFSVMKKSKKYLVESMTKSQHSL